MLRSSGKEQPEPQPREFFEFDAETSTFVMSKKTKPEALYKKRLRKVIRGG